MRARKGCDGRIVAVGSDHDIRDLVGSASEIAYNPLPKDDPQVRRPDITRARQLLHWEPKVDRREGLALTLGYFRMKVGSGSGQ